MLRDQASIEPHTKPTSFLTPPFKGGLGGLKIPPFPRGARGD